MLASKDKDCLEARYLLFIKLEMLVTEIDTPESFSREYSWLHITIFLHLEPKLNKLIFFINNAVNLFHCNFLLQSQWSLH